MTTPPARPPAPPVEIDLSEGTPRRGGAASLTTLVDATGLVVYFHIDQAVLGL